MRGRAREAGERCFLTRRVGNQDTVPISQPQELLGFSNAGMPQFSCPIQAGRGQNEGVELALTDKNSLFPVTLSYLPFPL